MQTVGPLLSFIPSLMHPCSLCHRLNPLPHSPLSQVQQQVEDSEGRVMGAVHQGLQATEQSTSERLQESEQFLRRACVASAPVRCLSASSTPPSSWEPRPFV
jgi:hypothetical protein